MNLTKQTQALLELARKATEGRWRACGKGDCSCGLITSKDYPIAEIVNGKWGDDYPALRYAKDSTSLNMKVEAYMEQITYGEVPKELVSANAKYIAACSPQNLIPLLERLVELEEETLALKDFAIWMTGCGYDFCQHSYFIKQRDGLLK